MYEPQRAQRLDEIHLGRIEVVELAVSCHHRAELHLHRCAVTGEPHPDILHGRTHARIFELGCAAGPSRIQRKAKSAMLEEGCAIYREWRDDWNFALDQLMAEFMLFADCGIGPSRRAVELGDQRTAIDEPYLIDPVLVA